MKSTYLVSACTKYNQGIVVRSVVSLTLHKETLPQSDVATAWVTCLLSGLKVPASVETNDTPTLFSLGNAMKAKQSNANWKTAVHNHELTSCPRASRPKNPQLRACLQPEPDSEVKLAAHPDPSGSRAMHHGLAVLVEAAG